MPDSAAIEVRPARAEDLETLVRFSAAMAWETEGRRLDPARLRRGVAAVLESPTHGFYLVAVGGDGAEVVGQMLVTFEWSDWRNGVFWWIQSVYVDPEWRRRGVYRRLHGTVASLARERGDVCGLRLYVERDNKIAQGTYEAVGLRRAPYEVFEEDFVLGRDESKAHGTRDERDAKRGLSGQSPGNG